MNNAIALPLAVMLSTATGTNHVKDYVYGDGPPRRTRYSHTKPFETTADARKRKKAERQRKKNSRRK